MRTFHFNFQALCQSLDGRFFKAASWIWLPIALFPAALQAQTLVGKIVDEKNCPLPYANVVLLSLPDSAYVTGTVSADDGTFALHALCKDRLVRVSSIGYTTLYKRCTETNLGTLQLQLDVQMLGEVVVKAELPKVRLKGDAQVTTVQGSILEKVGTGNDLLNHIPGVSAQEGTVNVFGSGTAEIYINGRKMRNAAELGQLESDNIRSVEVVRSPGARYDASVTAVVRIYTKRPQGEGFGFNNRFTTSYRYGWSVQDQIDLNYRKGGLDLGGMLAGASNYNGDSKTLTTETYLDQTWQQVTRYRSISKGQNLSAMFFLNYQFNEKHSIGARYSFDRTPKNKWEVAPMSSVLTLDGELYETGETVGWQNRQATGHSLNAYYNGKIGQWTIDFNTDGLWSFTNTPQNMLEKYLPAAGVWQQQTITSLSRDENTLYAAKLVAGHPLWGGNLSFGGEYTYTDRQNNFANEEGLLEDDHSNIRENAVSAFAEYSRSFGKLTARVGVRYEHLTSDYYEGGTRIDGQSRTYDNVFPSASLSLPVGKMELQLNYTTHINRPLYGRLRSNVTYANRYTYERGNPLLQPSLINRLSLNASYKWMYFNAGYFHIQDPMVQVCTTYSDDNPSVSLLTFYNEYHADRLYLTFSMQPTIGVWTPQLTLMLLQQWYKVDTPTGQENFHNPIGSFTWGNYICLPKGFSLNIDLGGNTRGESENSRLTAGNWYANLRINKSFLDDRLILQLQGTDLFNSASSKGLIYSGKRVLGIETEARRTFSFTVRYRFNAAKSKYKGTGAGSDQRNRM